MDLSCKAMETLKRLGVGRRSLDDPFFDDKPPPRLGVYDLDEENLCHEVVRMTCSVPGCGFAAESLLEHASHYDVAHRYACAHCRRLLPSPHLLDLHLQETHDSFFAVMAEKRPSYCCYTEQCKEKFQTADERFDHCVKAHRLPKDFRFELSTKKSHRKGKSKKKPEKIEISEEGNGNTEVMSNRDVAGVQKPSGAQNIKGDENTSGSSMHSGGPAMVPRHFSFGHSKNKTFLKPTFRKFTGNQNSKENHVDMDSIAMDLKESLPE